MGLDFLMRYKKNIDKTLSSGFINVLREYLTVWNNKSVKAVL
jgi:hypothetical protein